MREIIKKKGQIGVEYMIVVGFITFAIMSILALAFFYSDKIKDQIKLNQIESFATQVVNSAESVFFAGEPSKTTINLYLPSGVQDIELSQDSLIIITQVSSGSNKRVFESKVPLNGSIPITEGLKKIVLEAHQNYVAIN